MPMTQIDDLAETMRWVCFHRLHEVKRELSLSDHDIKAIARMVQTAFWASLQTRHKLDSELRTKVETLITSGDYPED